MKSKAELQREIRTERRAAVVINDYSRHGAPFARHACDLLHQRGYTITQSTLAHDTAGLHAAVRQALADRHSLIIVGGGDGTISAAVEDLADQDVVLGLLPLGTGNSFARSVGIPLTMHGALEIISEGKVADVDLGRVGAYCFANVANIGLSVAMAHHTSRRLKHYLGKLAYAIVGMRELLHHQPFRCRFLFDGVRRVEVQTHEVVIANGRVYGTTLLAPEASVDDGRFIIVTLDEAGRWAFLKDIVAFMIKERPVRPTMHADFASSVLVETDPPLEIDVDGESIGYTPAEFTIMPQALKLMVPRNFKDR